MEFSCPHLGVRLVFFLLLWTNSSRVPQIEQPLAAAAHQVCSCHASSGLARSQRLKGSQCTCARATLQWEAWHMGITRRFASKVHSSCKLEHDGVIPYKRRDRKNGSLFSSKDSNQRQGLSHSREGTLITISAKSSQMNEQQIQSRHMLPCPWLHLGVKWTRTHWTGWLCSNAAY